MSRRWQNNSAYCSRCCYSTNMFLLPASKLTFPMSSIPHSRRAVIRCTQGACFFAQHKRFWVYAASGVFADRAPLRRPGVGRNPFPNVSSFIRPEPRTSLHGETFSIHENHSSLCLDRTIPPPHSRLRRSSLPSASGHTKGTATLLPRPSGAPQPPGL